MSICECGAGMRNDTVYRCGTTTKEARKHWGRQAKRTVRCLDAQLAQAREEIDHHGACNDCCCGHYPARQKEGTETNPTVRAAKETKED